VKEVYLVANWKMNCNLSEASLLTEEILKNLTPEETKNLKIIFCPPFTALERVWDIIKRNKVKVAMGAQNCHFMPCGAFTGEISPKMLLDFCQYVILGHSERRQYFGETDRIINKKIRAAIDTGLRPIVCVGEAKKGEKSQVILSQVKNALEGLEEKYQKQVIFAYEPVWAIGTGDEAEPSYANKIIKEIKEILLEKTPVLYGGSVTSSNISSFIAQEMIDGALIGGASLKAQEFLKIIKKVKKNVG
jgi:triosephosphate isomerase